MYNSDIHYDSSIQYSINLCLQWVQTIIISVALLDTQKRAEFKCVQREEVWNACVQKAGITAEQGARWRGRWGEEGKGNGAHRGTSKRHAASCGLSRKTFLSPDFLKGCVSHPCGPRMHKDSRQVVGAAYLPCWLILVYLGWRKSAVLYGIDFTYTSVSEKAMASHSSTLAWKIPWMEGPGGLQFMGSLESDTTERLHLHFSLSCIGEGNGNPLQCSCLENPRDGEAWWAAVHGVAQSRTRLKRLRSSSSTPLSGFAFAFLAWWNKTLLKQRRPSPCNLLYDLTALIVSGSLASLHCFLAKSKAGIYLGPEPSDERRLRVHIYKYTGD